MLENKRAIDTDQTPAVQISFVANKTRFDQFLMIYIIDYDVIFSSRSISEEE